MLRDSNGAARKRHVSQQRAQPITRVLMVALDGANNRLVKKTMVWASAGMSQSWQLRAVNRRPRHAKRLWDLPVVR
jgi:hypothetical protein